MHGSSVRAGFMGIELSQLWPPDSHCDLQEYAAGPFTHCFLAQYRGLSMTMMPLLLGRPSRLHDRPSRSRARAGRLLSLRGSRFPRPKVCGEFVSAPSLQLLHELGIDESLVQSAGPEIRSLASSSAEQGRDRDAPRATPGYRWGRAVPRERLDLLLFTEAAKAGAEIWQPWSLDEV